MAKIRNKSGSDLWVPGHGIVVADGVLEVADAEVFGFTCSANWDASDKDATAAHNKGERDEAKAVKGASDPEPAPAEAPVSDG